MNRSNHLNDEPRDLDLSSLTFDEFVAFFFAREVVPDDQQYEYFLTDLHGEKYSEPVPSSPEIVVGHLTSLFADFGRIAGKYRLAQVDQGVWGMWGANLRLYELLFDPRVPLTLRLDCIRSMRHVYSDYVSKLEKEPDREVESGFYMWWDFILHGFWNSSRPVVTGTLRGDALALDAESRVQLDVLFETLTEILAIPNRVSQESALHGLGHLYHPQVRDAVQRFIDTNASGFNLKWLEQCRDCNVM
ncbi:MAG TPA: hypothetical protein VMB47_11445 [Candidatus Aquilonibacter sp.]|nr:hypothetical protein [Candidatus Aquilonibacter sp.]